MSESTSESVLAGIFEDEAPAPTPKSEPTPTETPEPETKPEPEAAANEHEEEPDETPEPDPTDPRTVPLKAYQAQRRERQDYKTKAAVAEAEAKAAREAAAALQARIAELEKPKPAPQTEERKPVSLPNPVEDPQGYAAAIAHQRWSDKLDLAQDAFEEANPDVNVDQLVERFKSEVAKEPSLGAQFRNARNPYKFAHHTIKRIDAMAEIGPDPAAFRSKLEAELRAKWEAERAASPAAGIQPVTPRTPAAAANLPRSLATARAAPPDNKPQQPDNIFSGVLLDRR